LPILICVVLIVLAVAWFYRPGPSLDRERLAHGEVLGTMTGLNRPVSNALRPGFVDANGDLIADPPGDVAQQLDPAEIVFSYIASDQNANNAIVFQPLIDALAKATGKSIRFLPLTDLDEQLAAMRDGTLHVCAFNTGAVPIAVNAAGFVPVSTLGGENGPQTYQLKLIATTRSNVRDMNQLRGNEITLTEMGANSGFKAPLVLLNQKFGLMPGRDFAIRYSGGYQQSIEGLAKGTYDIIAVASDLLSRAEKAGTISPSAYHVLYTSDPFPTACFGYTHKLKPELAKQVVEVLSGFAFTGTVSEFFGASGQTKLVPVNYASDFGLVRTIDDSIGYEHKLRTPRPPESTDPATAPAQ
jgi:phosphonate transport system substrate-binding protein